MIGVVEVYGCVGSLMCVIWYFVVCRCVGSLLGFVKWVLLISMKFGLLLSSWWSFGS